MDMLNQALPKITVMDSKKRLNDNEFCSIHEKEYTEVDYDVYKCKECWILEKEKEKEERAWLDKIRRAKDCLYTTKRQEAQCFENFETKTKEQAHALKSCLSFVDNWSESGGIVMLGSVGTGKTHLAVSICKKLVTKAVTCRITTVNKIVRSIRASWHKNNDGRYGENITEKDVIDRYSSYNVLVIDEIGSQYGTDSERIIVNEIINERYERMMPTIIIGNVSVLEAKTILGERVVDRIKNEGYALFFEWDSYRKLRA